MINFAGIVSNSTIDYPGKVCSVVYLHGCNFRCPWCHNPELVEGTGFQKTEIDVIVKQLKDDFLIDAVCVTGGEPLLQEKTIELLKKIKGETNLLLKIDHNLSLPEQLERALKYLDMITVDIKNSFDNYEKTIGADSETILFNIKKSLLILKNWDKFKEARTTIVPDLNDNKGVVKKIAEIVKENKFSLYTLQEFRSEKTLDKSFHIKESPSYEKMKKLGAGAKEILGDIKVQIVTKKNGFEEITL